MKELVKYTIGGISSSISEYIAYIICITLLKLSPYIGVIIGFIVSTLVSFLFNEFFVYVKKNNEKRSKIQALIKNFMTYFFTGIILKEVLIYVFLMIHIPKEIALIYILILIAPINYIMTKFWAFKKISD